VFFTPPNFALQVLTFPLTNADESQFAGSTGTSSLVILSAHYDSKAPFGSTRAPGGNDDGSGVVLLLEIARAINIHKINFKSNVQLVFFSGEELGLLGSAAYARECFACLEYMPDGY
jgi:Zn-dependent M28 family amino/carboxypeptidase